MLTWCFFVLFVFGENRLATQFRFCFNCVALCLEESLLEQQSLAWLKNDGEKGL